MMKENKGELIIEGKSISYFPRHGSPLHFRNDSIIMEIFSYRYGTGKKYFRFSICPHVCGEMSTT